MEIGKWHVLSKKMLERVRKDNLRIKLEKERNLTRRGIKKVKERLN